MIGYNVYLFKNNSANNIMYEKRNRVDLVQKSGVRHGVLKTGQFGMILQILTHRAFLKQHLLIHNMLDKQVDLSYSGNIYCLPD